MYSQDEGCGMVFIFFSVVNSEKNFLYPTKKIEEINKGCASDIADTDWA